jgi:hypothetical protein
MTAADIAADIAAARRKIRDCRGDILFLLLGTRDDEQIKRLVRALDHLSSFEKFIADAEAAPP